MRHENIALNVEGVGQTPLPIGCLSTLDKLSHGQLKIVLRLMRLQWGFDGRKHVHISHSKIAKNTGLSVDGVRYALTLLERPWKKDAWISAPLIEKVTSKNGSSSTYKIVMQGSNLVEDANTILSSPNIFSVPNTFFDTYLVSWSRLAILVYLRTRIMKQTQVTDSYSILSFNQNPIEIYGGANIIPPIRTANNSRLKKAVSELVDHGVLEWIKGESKLLFKLARLTDTTEVVTNTTEVTTDTTEVRTLGHLTDTTEVVTDTTEVTTDTTEVMTDTTEVVTNTTTIEVGKYVSTYLDTEPDSSMTYKTKLTIKDDTDHVYDTTIGDAIEFIAKNAKNPTVFKASLLKKARANGISVIDGDKGKLNIVHYLADLQDEERHRRASLLLDSITKILDTGLDATIAYQGSLYVVHSVEGNMASITHDHKTSTVHWSEWLGAIKCPQDVRIGSLEPTALEEGSIEWVLSQLDKGCSVRIGSEDGELEVVERIIEKKGHHKYEKFRIIRDGVEDILSAPKFFELALSSEVINE